MKRVQKADTATTEAGQMPSSVHKILVSEIDKILENPDIDQLYAGRLEALRERFLRRVSESK